MRNFVRNIKLSIAIAILSVISINAQVSVFDASDFIKENKNEVKIQSGVTSYEFEVFDKNAKELFNGNKTHIVINNFPLRPNYKVNLILSQQESALSHDVEIRYFKNGQKVSYTKPTSAKYAGFIEGASSSDVYLTYSKLGMMGYIQDETGQMYDVTADFTELSKNQVTHSVSETSLEKLMENQMLQQCGIDELDNYPRIAEEDFTIKKDQNKIQKQDLIEVKMAADGNFEFYLMFSQFITGGNPSRWDNGESWFINMTEEQFALAIDLSVAYIENVMSSVSRIYTREVGVIIKVPYITIFNDYFVDPYYQHFGTSLDVKLGAMPSIWNKRQNEAKDRILATVFTDTRRQPAGSNILGIARAGISQNGYEGVLCLKNSGFSALGLLGNVDFPRIAFSQDIQVAAHEFGHNFGCPHTHDCFWPNNGYTLIDSCVTENGPGKDSDCLKLTETRRNEKGTIMSYCHQNGRIVLKFDPLNKERIRDHAEEALENCAYVPTSAVIRLIRPLGDEVFFAGDKIKIAFNAEKIIQAKILFSSDLGKNWTELGKVNMAADTTFPWTVPELPGTKNMIRIESTVDAKIFDQSVLPFEITDVSIAADFPEPNGKIGYYSNQTIKWTRNNVGVVIVKLSTDNGATFEKIGEGNINTLSYNFPDIDTKEAILIVESKENSSIFVEIPFELGKESVVFNSPILNDTLNVNRNKHTVTFITDFVDSDFDMYFRQNQSGEWAKLTNIGSKVDLEKNEYIWTFSKDIQPGDLGELEARLKGTNEVLGASGLFKFEATTGVNLTFNSGFIINSIVPNPAGNQFALEINNAKNELVKSTIRIVGVDGKVYKTIADQYMVNGKSTLLVDVHDLQVGTYYIMIESDKHRDIQQLKVVR